MIFFFIFQVGVLLLCVGVDFVFFFEEGSVSGFLDVFVALFIFLAVFGGQGLEGVLKDFGCYYSDWLGRLGLFVFLLWVELFVRDGVAAMAFCADFLMFFCA